MDFKDLIEATFKKDNFLNRLIFNFTENIVFFNNLTHKEYMVFFETFRKYERITYRKGYKVDMADFINAVREYNELNKNNEIDCIELKIVDPEENKKIASNKLLKINERIAIALEKLVKINILKNNYKNKKVKIDLVEMVNDIDFAIERN